MAMEVDKADIRAKAVPESVMESVNSTLANVEDLRSHFDQFLSLSHPDVLSQLPPLQRALSLLTLARATSALFAVRLRCTGVHPEAHRVKGDLERISRYQDKLERYLGSTKASIQPSTKLNVQAANRFIQHSLPDLTAQQIRSLREIGKNEAGRINFADTYFQRKRKYQPPVRQDKPTIQAEVHEFLEKAASEVFDSKQGGHEEVKEPIVPILIEDSSEEEKEQLEEDDDDDDGDELGEDNDDDLEEEEDDDDDDDLEEEVEEKEKQETMRPSAPVFIILDSSDED